MISFIDHTGTERFLGNNPAPLKSNWILYGTTEKTPLIPRDKWPDFIRDPFEENIFLPPIRYQNGIGQCFPAGTHVQMANRRSSGIEHVNAGDLVLTAEGNIRRVTQTMVRREEKELLRVYLPNTEIRTTAEHPFLVESGSQPKYVPIGEIQSGTLVRVWNTDNTDFKRVPVTRIAKETYSGWVYNLEVEDDHSYVIHGVGVHNCNADATIAAFQYSRLVQGLPYVELSAADLYHRINGGQDNGSFLEDGIREMMAKGVGTLATCRTNLWKSPFMPATDGERQLYRITEAYLCPTFDHVMSAAIMGFSLVSGILWPGNDKLDGDGWLPPGNRAGGHAIAGFIPCGRKRGGSWEFGVGHRNSWGADWGNRGRFVIPEVMYSGPVGGWWACRVVTGIPDLPIPQAA